jgi:uncharacterized membrane protein YkoI
VKLSKRWLGMLVVLGVAIIAGGGLLVATAADDDANDSEQAITGDALEQASAAALAYTGEGRVTDTEAGDEEGAYEVEVTLDDGRQVDVHLDEDFNVLGREDDGADEDDD